jgi:cell division septation protein DedD
MATAGLNRMMLWGDFEGSRLENRWLLGRLVRPEGRRAWFEAIGPDGVPVMLSITEAMNDEDELMERMSAARDIRHPNAVAIREACTSHLDDVPVVVVAMEMTEENLGDVLRERLLTPVEGRQVLDAVLAALGAMHGHGLVHGHMEANSVLAMGETIKLRTDCVRLGGAAFAVAAADDVRAAARMAAYAVTGRFPANENDAVLQLLPEAMARAVRRALSGMAGATEVAALAGTKLELLPDIERRTTRIEPLSKTPTAEATMPVEKTAEVPGEMKTAHEPVSPQSPMKAKEVAPRVVAMRAIDVQAQAALFGEPAMLPNEREAVGGRTLAEDGEAARWPRAPYVIAAAIAVVLVTVFTVYGLLHSQPVEQKPAAPSGAAAATTLAPSAVMRTAAIEVPETSGMGWRVVAYTFNSEGEARDAAKTLAQHFSQLNPGVFAPKGGELWLVTVGGIMSRGDALVLRDRAVDMGLPEDTYAGNFR